jgi:hypothetical protein
MGLMMGDMMADSLDFLKAGCSDAAMVSPMDLLMVDSRVQ